MSRPRHAAKRFRIRWIPVLLVIVGVLVLALAGGAFAGYRYDRATASRVMPGVKIAGVDVSGMTRAQALAALEPTVDGILDRHLSVTGPGHTWDVTSRSLGTSVDVARAVDQAMAVGQSFAWPSRVFHRLLHKPVVTRIGLTVSYDRNEVWNFVHGLSSQVGRNATDASLDFVGGRLVVSKSTTGRKLRVGTSRNAVLAALQSDAPTASLTMTTVKPAVTENDLGMTIVVRTSTERLYLYDGLRLVKTYSVATGQPQYPTPLGHFEIINKRINPTWVNPALDSWGANEPAMIPPGPDNPLGTRAMDLSAPGIRIHGTPDDASIGHAASHGCIRMHIPDSEDLFNRVPIGTRVIIAV